MATNFPTSLDALTNPTSANKLNDAGVTHATQHANANDAIEALQAKVGVDSSAVTTSLDYKVRNVPIATAVTGLGTGVATFLATPTSANLATALTDETGSATVMFSTSPSVSTSLVSSTSTFALINTTATTVSFAGAATSFTVGGTPTTALTANIFNNATATATTKAVNIGTGGASGSTTNITLGSATAGSLGTTKLNTGLSIATPPAIITGTTYSATINDTALIFNTTASSTLTLPAAATYPGKTVMLKQIAAFTVVSASANVVPLGSTTAGTAILSGAGKFAYLVSDGTNWVTMMSN